MLGPNYARAFERALDEFEDQRQAREAKGRYAMFIAITFMGAQRRTPWSPPQTPQTAKPPNQITFLTVEGSKFKIFRGHSRSIFVQLKHFSNFARKHKIIFCAYFWRKVTKVDFWIKLHVPKNMKILLSILRYTKIISHFILRIINFKNFFH